MKTSLIPKNKAFWLYHLSLISALTLAKISLLIYSDAMVIEHSVRDIVWLFPFTLAVLYFRKCYREKSWEALSTRKILGISIFFSAISGIFISLMQILTLYSFSTKEFIEAQLRQDQALHWHQAIINLILYDTVNSFAFIFGWIFIYISITSTRREKQTELKNLRLLHSLKEAQLSNLSSQLNPHFLFNALNNIRFMIHEDAKCADKMLTSLSDILRYSLESSRQEKVELRQEIEIINRYVDIIKTQLEHRLQFSMNMVENHGSLLVPPMVLQMLVENAVKHGVENIQGGGRIIVDSKDAGDKLLLTVTNDTPENSSEKTDNIGIGLVNIKQRLRLLYADAAELNITKTNTLFKVEISLPMETNA